MNGPDLLWVGLDAPVGYDVPEELARTDPEGTFSQVELHVIFPEGGEGLL